MADVNSEGMRDAFDKLYSEMADELVKVRFRWRWRPGRGFVVKADDILSVIMPDIKVYVAVRDSIWAEKLAAARAERDLERKHRTRGGPPPASDKEWGNKKIEGPEHINGRT